MKYFCGPAVVFKYNISAETIEKTGWKLFLEIVISD
jgi:hypothetical protein